MKKLKLIYFLLAICTFSSCLDEDPQYALNSESVFLDENTAQLALLSCYGQLTTYDGFGQAAQELLAVSYTHLDVYKRQLLKAGLM